VPNYFRRSFVQRNSGQEIASPVFPPPGHSLPDKASAHFLAPSHLPTPLCETETGQKPIPDWFSGDRRAKTNPGLVSGRFSGDRHAKTNPGLVSGIGFWEGTRHAERDCVTLTNIDVL
jgi:hypothetical protein